MSKILEMVRTSQLKQNLPEIHPGDTVRVHARIREGNKERVQVFEGTVLRIRKDAVDASVTVRRISHSIGVERTFLLHSPRVDRFEIVRRGDVRRAALYYLRKRTGKATRIKEKRPPQQQTARQQSQAAVAAGTTEENRPAQARVARQS